MDTIEKDKPNPKATLPKGERLAGRTSVDTLFSDGKGGFVYPFRYIYTVGPAVETRADGSQEGSVRILFSVPKRYHKRANKRNLLKRRSREAYRQSKSPLTDIAGQRGKHLKVALIYSSKEVERYQRIKNAIRRIISEIHGRL